MTVLALIDVSSKIYAGPRPNRVRPSRLDLGPALLDGTAAVKVIFFVLFGFYAITSSANSHHPENFLKSIAGSKAEGQQIVQHYCITCHAENPLIPLGAPRIGHETDWKPRLRQGLKRLLKHTEEGIRAMPARGGCFECTDQQLLMAIEALLGDNKPQEKKHP